MAFVSYAQNFEDVMLWRALKRVDQGFYIDVGAQSPDLDSVTRAFSDAGWRGINVEPHPVYFADLIKRRPRDVNLNCALGRQSGSATFHLVGATGLSTLDQGIAGRHSNAGHVIEHAEVEVKTLGQVWDLHVPPGQPVHFLKVDVEGFEEQVLLGNDWSKRRPWIVVIEATAPNSQVESFSGWEPCLSGAGYEFVYKDGLNRYYVASEQAHLKGFFCYPPNVFDDFVVAPLAVARADLAERDSMLATVREQSSQLESFLRAELEQREVSLAQRGAELEERSQEVGQLGRDVADRDQLLGEVRAQLGALEGMLADSTAELSRVRQDLEEVAARAVATESDLAMSRHELEGLRAELGRVYGSRSWRLTAPLRAFLRFSRRTVSKSSGRG